MNREKPFVADKSDPTKFATIIHQHGYGVGTANYICTTVSEIGHTARQVSMLHVRQPPVAVIHILRLLTQRVRPRQRPVRVVVGIGHRSVFRIGGETQ
jgi:hypothetical protein